MNPSAQEDLRTLPGKITERILRFIAARIHLAGLPNLRGFRFPWAERETLIWLNWPCALALSVRRERCSSGADRLLTWRGTTAGFALNPRKGCLLVCANRNMLIPYARLSSNLTLHISVRQTQLALHNVQFSRSPYPVSAKTIKGTMWNSRPPLFSPSTG